MSVKRAFFSVFQKLTLFCCAMFFGFANAFAANLPSGYTELEYIESSGTQWIDTGYTPNQDTSVMLDAQYINYNSGTQGILFGARTSATENVFVIQRLTAGNWNMGYNAASVIVGTADTNRHMFYKDKQYQYLDGVLKGTGTYSSFTCPGTAILFGFNNAGTPNPTSFPAKIYSFKMWNNETLVRNLVPAKNSSGVVGMYDTVNNVFYTNKGTGTFTAGPVVGIRIATTTYNTAQFNPVVTDLNSTIATIRSVVTNTINQTKAIADLQAKKQTRPDEQCPAGKKCLLVEDNDGVPHWYEIIENIYGLPTGYTPLEYIESTGTQYIDTGYAWTSLNRKVDMDVMVTTYVSNSHFFASTHERAYDLNPYFGSASGSFSTYIGGRNYLSTTSNKNEKNNIVWNLKSNKNFNLQINNVNIGSVTVAEIPTSGVSVYLLHVHTSGNNTWTPLKARLYQTKMWDNDIMVRNFVPAKRNSDGVIGMYDLADTNPATAFHTNAGTGTFTAGPEI